MRIGIVNDMLLAREALRRVVLVDPRPPGRLDRPTTAPRRSSRPRARPPRPDPDGPDHAAASTASRRPGGSWPSRPARSWSSPATVSGHLGKVYEAMGHGALDAVDTPALGPARRRARAPRTCSTKIATVAKLIGKSPRLAAPAVGTTAAAGRGRSPPAWPLVVDRRLDRRPERAGRDPRRAARQRWDACGRDRPARRRGVRPGPGALAGRADRARRSSWPSPATGPRPGRSCWRRPTTTWSSTTARRLRYVAEPRSYCYRPSVDVFFAERRPATGPSRASRSS